MKIAIIGPGSIGSLFTYYLARAGHDVTVIARGRRLAELQQSPVIHIRHVITQKTAQVAIKVSAELDPNEAWDLTLVTVQYQQVNALLPTLAASNSKRIMFMFNAAGDIRPLRDAVGLDRFYWGFPAAIADIKDGVLEYVTLPGWLRGLQITTIGALHDYQPQDLEDWKNIFTQAGIASTICHDMNGWLKTHMAFMGPIWVACVFIGKEGQLSWEEAELTARAMKEGFRLLNNAQIGIEPLNMRLLQLVPLPVLTASVWASFRIPLVRWAAFAHVGHAYEEVNASLNAFKELQAQATLPAINALQKRMHDHVKR